MTGVTETHKSRRVFWAQVCRIMNYIVTEKKKKKTSDVGSNFEAVFVMRMLLATANMLAFRTLIREWIKGIIHQISWTIHVEFIHAFGGLGSNVTGSSNPRSLECSSCGLSSEMSTCNLFFLFLLEYTALSALEQMCFGIWYVSFKNSVPYFFLRSDTLMCFLAEDLRKFLLQFALGWWPKVHRVLEIKFIKQIQMLQIHQMYYNVIIKALNILLDYSGLDFWSRWLQQKSALLQRRKWCQSSRGMAIGCIKMYKKCIKLVSVTLPTGFLRALWSSL